MRNSRQPRCSAAILQLAAGQDSEGLGTSPEFESSDFPR
jgi:hypothetical protein